MSGNSEVNGLNQKDIIDKELSQVALEFSRVRGQIFNSPWTDHEKSEALNLLDSTSLMIQNFPDATTLAVAGNMLAILSDSLKLAIEENIDKQKHEKNSTTDILTGLPNRRGFEEAYDHVIKSIQSGKLGSATLVMVDANDFKTVNDWLGHNTGDRLLQAYANTMRSNTPPSDYVFRTGGDEFMILIEHRAKKPENVNNFDWVNPKAPPIIEQIQSVIQESYLTADHPDQKEVRVPFRLTFGMSNINPQLSMEQNIKTADAALYRNKPKDKSHYDHIRVLRPLNDKEEAIPLEQNTLA